MKIKHTGIEISFNVEETGLLYGLLSKIDIVSLIDEGKLSADHYTLLKSILKKINHKQETKG